MSWEDFKDIQQVINHANERFVIRPFVSQGDWDGRSLTIQVTDDGVVKKKPGLTLNLKWLNQTAYNQGIEPFECINEDESIFKVIYPNNMMTPGVVEAQIQILYKGNSTILKTFEITVQNNINDPKAYINKSSFAALDKALSTVNQYDTAIASLDDSKEDKTTVKQIVNKVNEDLNTKRSKDVLINSSDVSDELKSQIAGDAAIIQGLSDRVVTPIKTTFITSENMLNPKAIKDGYYVAFDNGTLRASTDYQVIENIPIVAGESYTLFQSTQIAFKSASFTFISGINGGGVNKAMTFTAPEGAAYVSISIKKTFDNYKESMMNKGSQIQLYKPYKEVLDYTLIDDISGKSLLNNTVDPIKTSFMSRKNLGDQTDILEGVYARYDNGQVNSNANYLIILNVKLS